jgi:uncharacterized membrane protein YfcA
MEILDQWPVWIWLALVGATIFAAVAHGAIGFGFPLISTPLVALITDVRTAVLTTLLPNILLNIISVMRGADWRLTLRSYWPVAAWVFAGALIGSGVLAYANPDALKTLLAALIVFYLLQSRRSRAASPLLHRHPRVSAGVFGLLGGFFSGTVNVAVPPLLIYFTSLDLAPLVLTQAMNLSFLVGRSTQVLALVSGGNMGGAWFLLGAPLSVIAVAALRGGFRLQRRFSHATFMRLMRALLWVMAAVLAAQVLRDVTRDYLR